MATLVQTAITYKLTRMATKSSALKNTAVGKSATLATAVSLGMGFLFSAMREDTSLVNTALAVTSIGVAVGSKGRVLELGDKYYKNVDEINKNIQKIREFNHRFQEWGVESRQLYRERTETTRTDVLKKNIDNLLSYVVHNDKFERSQAYSIIKNNSDGLIDSEFLTARQYNKLSNLPAHLQDYVDEYTSVNLKIGKTSMAATNGVGYFSNYKSNIFKPFDNVDVSKAFSDGLNRDMEFYKAQASTYVNNNYHLFKDSKESSLELYKKHLVNTFKNKESEFLEQGLGSEESFLKTKEHFQKGEDPVMKALMMAQGNSEHLKYSDYSKKYKDTIVKEIDDFNKTYIGDKNKESLSNNEDFMKLVDKMNNFRKGNNNLFLSNEYSAKTDFDVLQDLTIKRSLGEEPELFQKLSNDKYDFFGNMRVHDKILYKETNDGLRAIDRTITSYDSIERGILSSIESNLTPYFKALPFLPNSFRRFNAFANFKIKDKIVADLDNTIIKTFKEANYDVQDSLLRVKDTIGSVTYLKNQLINSGDNQFDLKKSVEEYNLNIKNNFGSVNEKYGISSNVKFERRTLNLFPDGVSNKTTYSGKEKLTLLEQFNQVEKESYNEYSKLLDMNFNGYKGFDAYSSKTSATSYHSYSLKLENDGFSFKKNLHNSNNVIVVDNVSYAREFEFDGSQTNGHYNFSYKKQDENVIYTTNAFIKEVQSQRLGSSITSDSSKTGVYVQDKEMTKYFKWNEFLNSDNKLKYWSETDVNLNPFSKRVSVNDEANLTSIYKKRLKEFGASLKFAKDNGVALEIDDAVLYSLGKNSKSKLASELEKHEINTVFNKLFEGDEFVFPNKLSPDELVKLHDKELPYIKDFSKEVEFLNKVRGLDISEDSLTNAFGSETASFLKHFDTSRLSSETKQMVSRTFSHSIVSNLQNINKTLKNSEIPSSLDELSTTFKSLNLDETINKKDAFLSYVDESSFLKDAKKMTSELEPLSQLGEIERVSKKNAITKMFKLSNSYDNFENIVGKETLKDNVFVNLDRLRHIDRVDHVADGEATLMRQSFTKLDLKNDGIVKTAFKAFKEFHDDSRFSNEASFKAFEAVEAVENVFNAIGIKKLNFESKLTSAKYVDDFLKRRVYNIAVTVAALATVDAISDVLVPDEVPFLGEGLKSAGGEILAATRFGLQVAINMSGLGYVFRNLEQTFPGMFTDNGMLAPLDLSDTNDEMFGKLYRGDEVAVKKNRFWYTSGRTDFEGGEVENFRKHLLYSLRHRDSGIYDDKTERFFRKDFLPTSLAWYMIDPYKEEKDLSSKGKMFPQSEQLFNDVFLIGGLLSSTVGEAIKPTLYINKEKWMNDKGQVLNPDYSPSDPTSKQFINVDKPNFLERVFIPMYEDTVRMSGMRGYLTDAVLKNSFLDVNTTSGKTELDRLDKHTSSSKSFEDLQLGGMFGTTEGIRRIYDSNKLGTTSINPVPAPELSWMPKDYYKHFNYGAFGIGIKESSLQGIDETSDLYTKFNTLAINAPYSAEFRTLKQQVVTNMINNKMNPDELYSAYKSLSYANAITGIDVTDRINLKADVEQQSVSVKRITDVGEFLGKDGRRYKLAGVGVDYDNPYSSEQKSSELKSFMNELKESDNLTAYVNQNKSLSVKIDEQGQYTEIYAPQFDKYKSLNQAHYLRENVDGSNPINSLIEFVSNAFKPSFLEKAYNNKDVASRFVDESIISPQFRDWADPVNSFLMPFVNMSERGVGGLLNSMILSAKVGNGSLAMPAINTLSFLKGSLFGESMSSNYYQEDLIANTLQKQREMSGLNNVYHMTGKENLSNLKTYLTPTERKFFKDIVNTSDLSAREKVYEESSARFRKVLDVAWKQQNYNYNGFDVSDKQINIANYDGPSLSNDNGLASAQLRQSVFGSNLAYEKSSMYKNFGSINLFNNVYSRLKKHGNAITGTRTMSTTFASEVDNFEN